MPDFSAELDGVLDDVDDILGETFTFTPYTAGTPNALAGTVSDVAGTPVALKCCRTRTSVGLEGGGAGGRTGVERFELTVNLARLGFTPQPRTTRVTLGSVTYKIVAVETENDGKSARVRVERLVSE